MKWTLKNNKRIRFIQLCLVPVVLILVMGCTHSSLYVESDPAGAEVFFDGKPKGITPVEFDFKWYGGHNIKLRKEGYQEYNELVRLKAPWHYQVPVDFFTTLIPTKISDHQTRAYTLEPQSETQDQTQVPSL